MAHLLVRYLRGPHPDPLLAEEAAVSLVLRTLGSADAARAGQARRSGRAHRELAEAAKAELAADPGRSLTLEQLGRLRHSSAFHVARVFRTETRFSNEFGVTPSQVRDEGRIRALLEAAVRG
jgi:AraC-like DNA-binding protein